jgi:LCP family protein required for cell wall assembly
MDASELRRRVRQTQRPTNKTVDPNYAKTVQGTGSTRAQVAVAPTPKSKPEPAATETPRSRRFSPIDMDLPGAETRGWRRLSIRGNSWKKARRLALRGTAAMLILLLVGGGILFSQGYFKVRKAFHGGTATAAALEEKVDPDMLKGEGRGRINILLLGRGGGNHEAPDLTDTIILASVDPVNNTTTMVSLPRDTWVQPPKHGAMKLNAAWQTGEFDFMGRINPGSTDSRVIDAGFDMADQTIESMLGVTIDYNVIIDFQAFQQAVDTVGGVTVNVPTDLVDPTMAWENGYNSTLAKAGVQNFDGKKALIYARSRETTSDFARSQRQRALLIALKDKVDTLGTLSNPVKMAGLIDAFGDNVATDLSLNNANRLYSILKRIPDNKVTSVGLGDAQNSLITTGMLSGQSVVLPKAGAFNYSAIQLYIRSQLKDPYITKENARVWVLNASSDPNKATATANDLKTYGYNVTKVAAAPQQSTGTQLVDLSKKQKKYTAHYLEQRLNVKSRSTMPDKTVQTAGADFVIIVGNNETIPEQN